MNDEHCRHGTIDEAVVDIDRRPEKKRRIEEKSNPPIQIITSVLDTSRTIIESHQRFMRIHRRRKSSAVARPFHPIVTIIAGNLPRTTTAMIVMTPHLRATIEDTRIIVAIITIEFHLPIRTTRIRVMPIIAIDGDRRHPDITAAVDRDISRRAPHRLPFHCVVEVQVERHPPLVVRRRIHPFLEHPLHLVHRPETIGIIERRNSVVRQHWKNSFSKHPNPSNLSRHRRIP